MFTFLAFDTKWGFNQELLTNLQSDMKGKAKKNLDKLNKEMLEFIFLEAKEKMSSTLDSMDILNKKGFAVMTVLLSIMGFIISFTTNDIEGIKFLIPYGILVVGFTISLFLLLKSVSAKRVYEKSFKPSDLLNVDEYFTKEKANLLVMMISWYDEAISYNSSLNKKSGFLINIALAVSTISLSAFVAIYVIFKV